MIHGRRMKVAVVLLFSLVVSSLAVLSGPLHEGDDQIPPSTRPKGNGPRTSQAVTMPPGLIALEITFGLEEPRPTTWAGEIQTTEGRVASLEVLEGAEGPRVDGAKFSLQTKAQPPAKKQTKKQARQKQASREHLAVLRALLDAPPSATVTITTGRAPIEVRLADLEAGRPMTFLDGQVSVSRSLPSTRLTGPDTEDDYPSVARGADGTVWMAYVEYHPERFRLDDRVAPEDYDEVLIPTTNGDRIRLRSYDGQSWPGARRHRRPA